MRVFAGFLLLVFLGAVLVFALQNVATTEIEFLNYRATLPKAALIVGTYLFGMVSGSALMRALRRSYDEVRAPVH